MKPKTYTAEKVANVAKVLSDAPALPPKNIPHTDTLVELSKHIKELHFKKNYDARQIVALLKENGIRTTLREIKDLLEKSASRRQQNVSQ